MALTTGAAAETAKKVGRPGRRKLDVEAKNKRTQQNRVAQRAYRERKEAKLRTLEHKIAALERLNSYNEDRAELMAAHLRDLLGEANKFRGEKPRDKTVRELLTARDPTRDTLRRELEAAEDAHSANEATAAAAVVADPVPQANDKPISTATPSSTRSEPSVATTSTSTSTSSSTAGHDGSKEPSVVQVPLSNNWDDLMFYQLDAANPFELAGVGDDLTGEQFYRSFGLDSNDLNLTNTWNSRQQDSNDAFLTSVDTPLAFPDIWNDTGALAPAAPATTVLQDTPPDVLPEGCDCGGRCLTDIKCDLLTRRVMNNESLRSIIAEKRCGSNDTCAHVIRTLTQSPHYQENDLEDLCQELMVKCKFDTHDASITVGREDVRSALERHIAA